MRRLLLDATTLASGIVGLAYRGPSARLIEELLAGTFEAVLCPTLIDELSRALRKPYFARRISAEQVHAALEDLTAISVLCADPTDPPRVLRDPNDDYLLAWRPAAVRRQSSPAIRTCLITPAFSRRRSPLARPSSS